MTLEDHAKNVIYNQSIQISALTVALDAAQKELVALRPKPVPADGKPVDIDSSLDLPA